MTDMPGTAGTVGGMLSETEAFLRSFNPAVAACLAEVDSMAALHSPGWHAMRSQIFFKAAMDTADLHEAGMLVALYDRSTIALELMGPAEHMSDEVRAAVGALAETSPELVQLTVPDYRPHDDSDRAADDSSGSDVQMDTSGRSFAQWMGQPRRPSAGWSAPGGPGGGQDGHQGTEKPSRVRAVQKRRAKLGRAARKRAAAARRYRTRGGR